MWFWYFLVYSFFGFLLEITFAWLIGHPKRDRKCFYFLPLCPVYGLGAVAILLMAGWVGYRPFWIVTLAVPVATAVEYGVALFYEGCARVRFWDYGRMPFNLQGRVCLVFSLFWCYLSLFLVFVIHPRVAVVVAQWPMDLGLLLAVTLVADGVYTLLRLRRFRTTDALKWGWSKGTQLGEGGLQRGG